MEYSQGAEGRIGEIAGLFAAAFTASEGAGEGRVIGALARALIDTTPPADLRVFSVAAKGHILGAAIFTRLACAGDAGHAMLLSPMAVIPARQGEGIGQRLIAHALGRLRAEGVTMAVTYGDPAFYGKTGFAPVTTRTLPPPHPLSQPEGWIAQALDGAPLAPRQGPCRCVPALNDPVFW